MKIVNDCGVLIRMTERNFVRYLHAGSRGEKPEPSTYGKPFADVAFHTLDAKPADFEAALMVL